MVDDGSVRHGRCGCKRYLSISCGLTTKIIVAFSKAPLVAAFASVLLATDRAMSAYTGLMATPSFVSQSGNVVVMVTPQRPMDSTGAPPAVQPMGCIAP